MSDFLRKNPNLLRTCILYEFAEKKPIFEAFQHFCEVLGEETMDYPEFEFWFQRFAAGEMDLNYERGVQLITRTLTDMPMDVFEKIIENLDLMDRFIIRKVSKHLRSFIDSLSPGFKLVTIRIYESATTVCYDQNAVAYSNRPRQFYDKIDICFVEIGDERVEIKNATHEQLAAQDLKIVLRNPKLELEELEMERCCFWHSDRLVEMFKSIPSPIHVERLQMIVNNPLKELEIIGSLRPDVLKTIQLDMENHGEKLEKTEMKGRFDAMIATPQCQQAEMMTVVTYLKMEEFPMGSFLLAPRFTLNFEYLSVKDVMNVFRNLSKFVALDHFILKSDQRLNLESVRKQLSQRFSDIPDRPNCMHYWDRKSLSSFEIRFSESEIRVAKQKSRDSH